jgi:hypothetical protein
LGYAGKRSSPGGAYYRGRFKIAPRRYGTVLGPDGASVRFRTKREAEQAADDAEARIRGGQWRDPAGGLITFGEFANRWYAGLDLAPSTMQNYQRHLEEHLLPAFEDLSLAGILQSDVDAWEKREREPGTRSRH